MASKEWSNHYHLIQYQLFLQRQWNIIVRVNIIYYVIICMKGDDVHEEVLRIILNRWVWGWKLIFQLVRWFPSHISRLLPIFFGQCDISPSKLHSLRQCGPEPMHPVWQSRMFVTCTMPSRSHISNSCILWVLTFVGGCFVYKLHNSSVLTLCINYRLSISWSHSVCC